MKARGPRQGYPNPEQRQQARPRLERHCRPSARRQCRPAAVAAGWPTRSPRSAQEGRRAGERLAAAKRHWHPLAPWRAAGSRWVRSDVVECTCVVAAGVAGTAGGGGAAGRSWLDAAAGLPSSVAACAVAASAVVAYAAAVAVVDGGVVAVAGVADGVAVVAVA